MNRYNNDRIKKQALPIIKGIVYLFLSLFILPKAYSQTPQQWVSHGDKSFDEKDYYGAAYYYKKAVQKDSSYTEAHLKYGHSLRMYNEYKLARKAYAYIWENDAEEDYTISLFYLATMEKQTEQYVDALHHFKQYIEISTNKSSWEHKKAKKEIESCQWAIDNKDHSIDTIDVKNAGNLLNSVDAEISPVLLSDTSMLFANLKYDKKEKKSTQLQEANFAIYTAYKRNNQWEADTTSFYIEELPFPMGYANPTFSLDSNWLYYTLCKEENCHIYISHKEDTAWGKPQRLNEAINIEGFTSTQPFIVQHNGLEYLFFSSNRPKTRGEFDIWYSIVKESGKKYGRAKNVGRKINSPDNELTPYFVSKNATLFFSSSWHNGFGGYDIFSASGEPKNLSEPKNMGIPYNSSSNDLYYSFREDLKLGTLVSNRSGGYAIKGETCCNDIYTVKTTPIKIDSLPLDTPIVEIDSNILALETPPTSNGTPDEPNLQNILTLQNILPLAVYFENDQPLPYSNSDYQTLYNNYQKKLPTYVQHNAIDLFGIFVNQELDRGFENLNKLSDSLEIYLQKGYEITLGIRGFTSPLASKSYNEKLAKRRIESVKRFFSRNTTLSKYIDQNQLRFIPYIIGEKLSNGLVNDNAQDTISSVYNIGACRARKVEIGWINQNLSDDKLPILQLERVVYPITNKDQKTVTIPIFNPGNDTLKIEASSIQDKDYIIQIPQLKLAPGKHGKLILNLQIINDKRVAYPVSIRSNARATELNIWLKFAL